MSTSLRRRPVTGGIAALCLAATAALAPLAPSPAAVDGGSFYDTPAILPPAAGDVVRSEPADFHLDPLRLVQPSADVTRIMYRTTDHRGVPVAATGTVLVSHTAWSGAGPRPLVSFQVGTQGVADKCAPSRQMQVGTEYEGPFLAGLLLAGYAVVIPDYIGLGTEGAHTYMNRAAQAHAVLDGVRAARHLEGAGLGQSPVALAGYSQGGAATGAAAELASSYAPELPIKGAAVGAMAGDLRDVPALMDGGLYAVALAYALTSVEAAYGLDLGDYFTDAGLARLRDAADTCMLQGLVAFGFTRWRSYLKDGGTLTEAIDGRPVLAAAITEQRIGVERKPGFPTLVTHSLLDDAIPYASGRAAARRWCNQDAPVRFSSNLAPGHVGGAVVSYAESLGFLADRFRGRSFSSNCGWF